MSNAKKIYWQNLQQLKNNAVGSRQADENGKLTEKDEEYLLHSRRDFLKTMGFSVAAASLAACEAPIRKAIPYARKPVDVDPSIPNYYASTFADESNYCSIVVKTREGRPIKIEGNRLSEITRGGMNAQAEASVMSLYDDYRLRGPKKGNDAASWEDIDSEIMARLEKVSSGGGLIRVVSNTILSPSTKAAIDKFTSAYANGQHIQYDPVSCSGIIKANKESFGEAFIPLYDFSKAKRIVSIGADFLGTWLSPITFTKQYVVNRRVSEKKRDMSRHYQFEANLSMTGASADYRTMIRPSQEGAVAVQLYNLIAGKAGRPSVAAADGQFQHLSRAAEELWSNRGKSLVVSGSNDWSVQLLVNGINDMLGSYGNTILFNSFRHKQGDDEAMAAFVGDVQNGRVGAVILYDCNPVYDHPMGEALGAALKKVPLSVSTAYTENETSSAAHYKAPNHHYLESWNDFEPVSGSYSLAQPVITPLFDTRQAQESLMSWAGEKTDYFSFVKDNWRVWFEEQWDDGVMSFQRFWDKCLYDGVFRLPPQEVPVLSFSGNLDEAAVVANSAQQSDSSAGFEISLYESYALGAGSQANNPLLQELPDPITKTVWDHPATISQQDAAQLGVENDAEGRTQYLSITVKGKTVEMPALVQPGQAPGTIGIALGYGRTKVGRVAENLGINAYRLASMRSGSVHYSVLSEVKVQKQDKPYQIAQTQIQSTYMGRHSVIQEARLGEFKKDPYAGRQFPKITKWDKKVSPGTLSLWKGHEYKGHHWGMAIDLNSCTGCGTCIVACNVENNVAVVGKEEVVNRREMHWMRIDRYYSSPVSDAPSDESLEKAAANPEVVFQPMLCQHCNNAPCETVCPVAATTHSTEGLNQMAYNRCVGTRYCANNCPYKVRRFNWFKYHHNRQFADVNPSMNTDLGRMVLNPDVTVRSRGVMEKCSLCVQRIQEGKLKAKRARRPVKDGEIVTACQASCPAGAIVFGDLNDPKSRVSRLLQIEPDKENPHSPDKRTNNPRAYIVLEEVGVKPNVFYLTKIKNKDSAKA